MSFFSLHHLMELLHSYGIVVVGVIIALESLGLPLPGETLLIAGAVLAGTTHQLNIAFVIVAAAVGAIVGQAAGYAIGWSIGFRLLRRYGRYIGLTEQRLELGRQLFARHGSKVVLAARFVVLLRTLAALLAGANRMPLGSFMVANIAGSVVWSTLYGLGAYFLGHEAAHLAGPVAIGIGAVVAVALVAGFLILRRNEHRLLAEPVRTAPE
ncbi:MAG TPA: DedA family protein [Acetobacteraceae bacterium]|nr:DedA family protein [Acetobacteraceae bacterium]